MMNIVERLPAPTAALVQLALSLACWAVIIAGIRFAILPALRHLVLPTLPVLP